MAKKSVTDVTPKKKEIFLTALRNAWSVRKASKRAGISRMTAYRWKGDDEEFSKAWDDAIEEGTDCLEEIAAARAMRGKSDTLLIFLLKGRRPEKYRDHHPGQDEDPKDTAKKVADAIKDLDGGD